MALRLLECELLVQLIHHVIGVCLCPANQPTSQPANQPTSQSEKHHQEIKAHIYYLCTPRELLQKIDDHTIILTTEQKT